MARRIQLPLTRELSRTLHAGDQVLLSGTIYTSRDAGHKRMCEALARGEELPFDPTDATIYYVGPTPAKPGQVIGSAGPTTSGRMDAYAPRMMEAGARGMIGKGARLPEVIDAIREYEGTYFGAIGGAGALLAKSIKKSELIAYEDLGAEALQQKAEEMGFNTQLDFSGISVSQSTIDLSGANANELGWAGVGQYTVLSNPYHMMVLMGAIANGGEYVEPWLTQGGGLLEGLTGASRQLVTATEAQNLKTLLRHNVEYYYGDYLFPSGMNVCAKTGTGEVGEDQGPNCWMVGFCDSQQYPYAFAVLVEDGTGGIESAGSVASAVLTALAG